MAGRRGRRRRMARVVRPANEGPALVAAPDDIGSKPGGTGECIELFMVPAGHGRLGDAGKPGRANRAEPREGGRPAGSEVTRGRGSPAPADDEAVGPRPAPGGGPRPAVVRPGVDG